MGINHIELRHLRYFRQVAEERNFSRAADKLHISQPPLSRQIKLLEEMLDVQLFRRTKRTVVLTEAGAHLVKVVDRLMRDIGDVGPLMQAVARGEVGELKVGIVFSASMYPRFSEVVRLYRARYPGVRMIFKEVPYDRGMELVYNGDLDLCFQRPFEAREEDSKIVCQIFVDDYVQLCLPRQHRLARKKAVDIGDLRDMLFLVNPNQTRSPMFEQLQKLAHKAGFFLSVYQDTANFPVLANLVAAGYGVAFLPPSMSDAAHGEVVFRSLSGLKREACHQPLVVAYRRGDDRLPLRNFLDMAKLGRKARSI